MHYTPNDWRITFENQGFVIVDDLVDNATLLRLRHTIENITSNLQTLSPELREKVFLESTFTQPRN